MLDYAKVPEIVEVDYHFVHAMHVFTSVTTGGLVHVDSQDREEAFNLIAPVLSRHVSMAAKRPVRYVPSTDYKGFVAFLSGESTPECYNLAFELEKESAHV